MKKYPSHDQEYFYKFTSIDTARKILGNGKFRYSSPVKFNDPFDIQSELYFDFDIGNLSQIVIDKMDDVITGKISQKIDLNDNFGKAISLFQQKFASGRYEKSHLDVLVKPLIEILTEIIKDTRNQYNQGWVDMLKKIKVFCIAEHNKSVLMWSHYSDCHTGLCFKLKVMSEKDNPLCAAKKVNYLPKPSSFYDVEQWVQSVIFGAELNHDDLYHNYPLSKSDVWSYEDEWRVWAPFEKDDSEYLDIPIWDGEIDAIYFGLKAKPEDITEIMQMAANYGVEKFFTSKKQVKEYGLEYTPI